MRLAAIESSVHGETLLAVILGALLATLSGIVATQLEAYFKRRERGRDAALLIGELLSTVRILLNSAVETQKRGDPYGPITVRMLRAVRREIDIYDRNRELLYELRDPALRVRIHALIVRIAMPLDGILDTTVDLFRSPDDPALAPFRQARERGFAFLLATAEEIPAILSELGRGARHAFATSAPPTPP